MVVCVNRTLKCLFPHRENRQRASKYTRIGVWKTTGINIRSSSQVLLWIKQVSTIEIPLLSGDPNSTINTVKACRWDKIW